MRSSILVIQLLFIISPFVLAAEIYEGIYELEPGQEKHYDLQINAESAVCINIHPVNGSEDIGFAIKKKSDNEIIYKRSKKEDDSYYIWLAPIGKYEISLNNLEKENNYVNNIEYKLIRYSSYELPVYYNIQKSSWVYKKDDKPCSSSLCKGKKKFLKPLKSHISGHYYYDPRLQAWRDSKNKGQVCRNCLDTKRFPVNKSNCNRSLFITNNPFP
jgi:hypothetical protein